MLKILDLKTNMNKKYQIKDIIRPGIVNILGSKYIMPGWIPISDNITLSDIEYIKPDTKLNIKKYKVKGSRKNIYTVTVNFSDKNKYTIKCSCPAGKYRGNCKHQIKIKNKYNI